MTPRVHQVAGRVAADRLADVRAVPVRVAGIGIVNEVPQAIGQLSHVAVEPEVNPASVVGHVRVARNRLDQLAHFFGRLVEERPVPGRVNRPERDRAQDTDDEQHDQ